MILHSKCFFHLECRCEKLKLICINISHAGHCDIKGNMIEHNLTEGDREGKIDMLGTKNHFVNFIQTIFQSRQLKEHNTTSDLP